MDIITSVTPTSIYIRKGYNDMPTGDVVMALVGLPGWSDPAPMRRNNTARLRAPGNFPERGYQDAKLVTVQGHAWASTRASAAQLEDTLGAFLKTGYEGTITVDDKDKGIRTMTVGLTGKPSIVWNQRQDIDMIWDLIAADPNQYGPEVDLTVTTATPATWTHNGTAETTPRLYTATGTMPNGFTLTETVSGNNIIYTGAIGASDSLVIDGHAGTATLNGVTYTDTLLTGRQWTVVGGGKNVNYTLTANGSSNASIDIKVAPAW